VVVAKITGAFISQGIKGIGKYFWVFSTGKE